MCAQNGMKVAQTYLPSRNPSFYSRVELIFHPILELTDACWMSIFNAEIGIGRDIRG